MRIKLGFIHVHIEQSTPLDTMIIDQLLFTLCIQQESTKELTIETLITDQYIEIHLDIDINFSFEIYESI